MSEKTSKLAAIIAIVSLAIAGVALASTFKPSASASIAPVERTIYMVAIEPKGATTVDKEPFPSKPLPEGKGYVLKKPDPTGRWEVSSYRWDPSVIVVYQGDKVTLKILGINGDIHDSFIQGYNIPFVVKRGQVTEVSFTADKVGTFMFWCNNHLPTMEGYLLVLPR